MAKLSDLIVKTTVNENIFIDENHIKFSTNTTHQMQDKIYLPAQISSPHIFQFPSDFAIACGPHLSHKVFGKENKRTIRIFTSTTFEKERQIEIIDYNAKPNREHIVLSNFFGLKPTLCLDAKKFTQVPDFQEVFCIKKHTTALSPNHTITYHTLNFGSFPQSLVDEQLQTELDKEYSLLQTNQSSLMKETGKIYRFINRNVYTGSKEFEYKGEKYIQFKIKRSLNTRFYEKVMFNNGIAVNSVAGQNKWFKVEPITWLITNYNNLVSYAKGSKQSENIIRLTTQDVLLSCMPYSTSLVDKSNLMWQNSIIRAYFNGYNLLNELILGNGDLEQKAIVNYDFSASGGFLKEAFDEEIELTKNKNTEQESKKEPISENLSNPLTSYLPEQAPIVKRDITNYELIKNWIDNGESVLLRGPSGIGKTSMLLSMYGDRLIRLKLTDNMFPEKIVGSTDIQTGAEIPPNFARIIVDMCSTEEESKLIEQDIQNIYKIAEDIYNRSQQTDKKIVILLDELLNVKPQVQSLVYSLVLEKVVEIGSGIRLPKNVVVVATGNPQKYSMSSYQLAEPLEKRFDHILDLEPRVSEWLYNFAQPNKLHPYVVNYILYKFNENNRSDNLSDIGYFYEEPNVAEEHLDKNGAKGKTNDPRNWEKVSTFLYNFERDLANGNFANIDVHNMLARSLMTMLRDEWAKEFYDFYTQPTLTVDKIVNKDYTTKDLPTTINSKFALISMLLSANEKQVQQCRQFIYQTCGEEFLTFYDLSWCGDDIKRQLIINELPDVTAYQENILETKGNIIDLQHIDINSLDIDTFFALATINKMVAIKCKNEKDAQELIGAFRIAGRTWSNGENYLDSKFTGNKTCYTNTGEILSVAEATARHFELIDSIDTSKYLPKNKRITLDIFLDSRQTLYIKCNASQTIVLAHILERIKPNTSFLYPYVKNIDTPNESLAHFSPNANYLFSNTCTYVKEDNAKLKNFVYDFDEVDITKYMHTPYKMSIDAFIVHANIGNTYAIKCDTPEQAEFLCNILDFMGCELPTFSQNRSYLKIPNKHDITFITNNGKIFYAPTQSPDGLPVFKFKDIDFRRYTQPENKKIDIISWLHTKNKVVINTKDIEAAQVLCDIINVYHGKHIVNSEKFNAYNVSTCFDNHGNCQPVQYYIQNNYKIIDLEDVDYDYYKKISIRKFIESSIPMAIRAKDAKNNPLLVKSLNAYCSKNNIDKSFNADQVEYYDYEVCLLNDGTIHHVQECKELNIPVYLFENSDAYKYLKLLDSLKAKKEQTIIPKQKFSIKHKNNNFN